jgi:hypothetical protein
MRVSRVKAAIELGTIFASLQTQDLLEPASTSLPPREYSLIVFVMFSPNSVALLLIIIILVDRVYSFITFTGPQTVTTKTDSPDTPHPSRHLDG